MAAERQVKEEDLKKITADVKTARTLWEGLERVSEAEVQDQQAIVAVLEQKLAVSPDSDLIGLFNIPAVFCAVRV